MGFDPQQVAFVKAQGYIPTARVSNPLNLTPARITQTLDDIEQTGARVVIFADDEVLGYDTLASSVARQMRARGLIFTNIEFAKQRGAGDFALLTDGDLVRLHTVNGDELARADPEVVVERFVRAARERDMRVLYMRLLRGQKGEPTEVKPGDLNAPLTLEKTPYQQNLDFVQSVSDDLQRAPLPGGIIRPALTMGAAQPFGNYPLDQFQPIFGNVGARVVQFLMLFLSGVGTVGMTLLVLNLFFDLTPQARRNWLLFGLVLVAGLSLKPGKGAQVIGMDAGIMASIVAMLWGGLPQVWDGVRRPKNDGVAATAWFGFGILLVTTLLTLALSLHVVALLNEWRYFSKADEFLGEKATQMVPLLVIPLAFLGELFPHRVIESGATPGTGVDEGALGTRGRAAFYGADGGVEFGDFGGRLHLDGALWQRVGHGNLAARTENARAFGAGFRDAPAHQRDFDGAPGVSDLDLVHAARPEMARLGRSGGGDDRAVGRFEHDVPYSHAGVLRHLAQLGGHFDRRVFRDDRFMDSKFPGRSDAQTRRRCRGQRTSQRARSLRNRSQGSRAGLSLGAELENCFNLRNAAGQQRLHFAARHLIAQPIAPQQQGFEALVPRRVGIAKLRLGHVHRIAKSVAPAPPMRQIVKGNALHNVVPGHDF